MMRPNQRLNRQSPRVHPLDKSSELISPFRWEFRLFC